MLHSIECLAVINETSIIYIILLFDSVFYQPYVYVPRTTAYQRWNCQVIQTCKLLSTHPSKPFPLRFSGSESVCSGYADLLRIKAATTLGLLATMATHPALRRCTAEPWPYYKLSMSGVCSQCHKSWGELFVQSLFWLVGFRTQSLHIITPPGILYAHVSCDLTVFNCHV